MLEYDPQPPFDTGSPEKAGAERVKRIRERLAPLLESRRKANAEAATKTATVTGNDSLKSPKAGV